VLQEQRVVRAAEEAIAPGHQVHPMCADWLSGCRAQRALEFWTSY